jgi:hypothetical protein
MNSRESVPLDGRPNRPYIESEGQVTDGGGFSRPSGRDPEGSETSKHDLQGRPSCLCISVRPGMVIVMISCPHRGMVWRDATVSIASALLARWWFANRPIRHELAVAFIIVSCSPDGVVATVREQVATPRSSVALLVL